MTLIKSISGIRGTIGGLTGQGLTPIDLVKFTTGYILFVKSKLPQKRLTIVVGRDARISGDMVNHIVVGTLLGLGVDVIDIGLSTTPTVEFAVTAKQADGGIILTASHNPKHWNALKLLNDKGEFLSAADANKLLHTADNLTDVQYANVDALGSYTTDDTLIQQHIKAILDLELVDVQAIKKAKFKVALDAINSTGSLSVPPLLEALGVVTTVSLNATPDGLFAHNPEPLTENIQDLLDYVVKEKADVGFAVDPDVDRLAIVCEDGAPFGEEYTLVAVADYVLQHQKGATVSNLSSTQALRVITEQHKASYFASAVGEVNVVEAMKAHHAVIGGEGNGGVIYPKLHYGRDALVGIALFLSYLAKAKKKCSQLRFSYPNYFMAKKKIVLDETIALDVLLQHIAKKYKNENINTIDGVRIDFGNKWIHLRKSNTEPIIRIYSEGETETVTEVLITKLMADIHEIIRS